MVFGTRKGCEGARLGRLLTVVRDVSIGEHSGSSWIIDGHPRHECLDESNIPALEQKEQASLRVEHKRAAAAFVVSTSGGVSELQRWILHWSSDMLLDFFCMMEVKSSQVYSIQISKL